MIRKYLVSCLIITGIFLISCDESVNTNADFRERYILTSIIDCNSTKQFAYVTKTYDNSIVGREPEIESVFIHGADIKIWYKYDVYDLVDTIITDNKDNAISCYVANNLKPDGDKIIEIEALLPNNLLLSSITRIPVISKIRIENTNAGQIYNSSSEGLHISWTNVGNYIYDTRLIINYYLHSDTNSNVKEKVVPLDLIIEDSDTTFIYSKPSNKSNLSIARAALNNALAEISKGDSIKFNYVIVNMKLQIKVYDENLSAYFSSSHQFLDQFSISLDTQLYSNINSGLGIFASYISKNLSIGLDKEYISSFGYRYGQ